MKKEIDFGFKTIPYGEKESKVQQIFSQVADKYDLMNDFMSMGLHRLWKRELISHLLPCEGKSLLDIAGGTGDISKLFLKEGGRHATVCDLNEEMLRAGQKKILDNNIRFMEQIDWVAANAQSLPFKEYEFDYVTVSFGIRNFSDREEALKQAFRVLKPGGKFVCMEFSHVTNASFAKFYDFYSFKVIPSLGKLVAGDSDSYQYLVESIRKFPKAHEFAKLVENAGFHFVDYKLLLGGMVAIHWGYKV